MWNAVGLIFKERAKRYNKYSIFNLQSSISIFGLPGLGIYPSGLVFNSDNT
ncbi:hypothetical protein D1AOALGA4SA_6462 [Olavius algarvensis Delta 1 endosymbiont]|nr:hypothetical protein D1AOALGA4SA_6462 [Olavius algarvensis Delta 1 endosymbiont]